MKRILSVILISFGLVNFAYANDKTNLYNNYVIIPKLAKQISIGFGNFYATPANNHLQYAIISSAANPLVGQVISQQPGYHYGFDINLGYDVPDTPNSISLQYTYYSTSDTNTIDAPQGQVIFSPLTPSVVNLLQPADFQSAVSTQKFKFRQTDLIFGHAAQYAKNLVLTYYGGIRYAHIRFEGRQDYFNGQLTNNPAIPVTDIIVNNNIFHGIGLVAGIKTHLNLFSHFYLMTNFTSSLLVGTRQGFTSEVRYVNNVFTPIISLGLAKETHLFPTANIKLGLGYLWQASKSTKLDIEGGFRAGGYFNVITQIRDDLSIIGPYLKVTLHTA